MSHNFQINGPFIVQLQFSAGVPIASGNNNGAGQNIWELGLTLDSVNISPNYHHYDVLTDSFGRKIPADTLCDLADCIVTFKLVNFDSNPLDLWLSESTAGGDPSNPFIKGVMPSAGTPMGGGLPLYSSGNHYTRIILQNPSTATGAVWSFPATYLTGPPVVWPIGTVRSIVECRARALPYQQQTSVSQTFEGNILPIYANAPSQGAVLWRYDPPV